MTVAANVFLSLALFTFPPTFIDYQHKKTINELTVDLTKHRYQHIDGYQTTYFNASWDNQLTIERDNRIYINFELIYDVLEAGRIYSEDGESIIEEDGIEFSIRPNDDYATLNGKPVKLIGKPFQYNSNLYVPLDPVFESFGITFNKANNRLHITRKIKGD
ncbi:stalk domain-containing protein [Brevibacillus choshinensis]|uniref:stalk domain-containing protein n=1 Tax=Brevibacillus choshinensis TaxID=54911 RepID=UPI002E21977D|nr:stalk domain-containing protein [Brevibacillus choshinensis]